MNHWKSSCAFSGLHVSIWNSRDPNYLRCIAGRRERGMKLGKLRPKDSSWKPSFKAFHTPEEKNASFPICDCLWKGKWKGSWFENACMLELWIWSLCPWLKWGMQLQKSLILTDKPRQWRSQTKISCQGDRIQERRQTWEPPAYLHFPFFVKCASELLGLQTLGVLRVHYVYRYRSRDVNFIYTDSKKQLRVPLTCDQSQFWLLPHDISMRWRISLFFFFARGKWIHYPAMRHGASGCVTLGWFGFHARAGV